MPSPWPGRSGLRLSQHRDDFPSTVTAAARSPRPARALTSESSGQIRVPGWPHDPSLGMAVEKTVQCQCTANFKPQLLTGSGQPDPVALMEAGPLSASETVQPGAAVT